MLENLFQKNMRVEFFKINYIPLKKHAWEKNMQEKNMLKIQPKNQCKTYIQLLLIIGLLWQDYSPGSLANTSRQQEVRMLQANGGQAGEEVGSRNMVEGFNISKHILN